jgi:hypothetical protein
MTPEAKKNIAYRDFLSVRKFINDYAAGILVLIPIIGNISAKYVEAFAYEIGFLKEVHGDLWILVNLFAGLAAAYYVMRLFRDKQKTAEEAQDRAAFIHDLMLALPSGVFYRDAKNIYLYVNNEGCDIF